MIINNITGTNSLKSNCQPDNSKAMLTNIHEFISSYEEQPTEHPSVDPILMGCDNLGDNENMFLQSGSDMELFDSIIFIDSETEDQGIQSGADQPVTECAEKNAAVATQYDASRICQKIFKVTTCKECRQNFDLMDRNSALSSVQELLSVLNRNVAEMCTLESIKKTLIHSVQGMKILVIGCADHVDLIERKVKDLAVEHILLSFCTNINKILSGKITALPDKPSVIQKLAFEHRMKKKGIGKFTDQFN